MDLVVRTPHGDADLTVVSWSSDTTVADLVEAATGQVAPALVHIDDRPLDASTRLVDAPILVGSVVSSHPDRESWSSPTAARIQQLTGSGAGTVRPLDEGRYRIGPGRRLSAQELADAPVEHPVFELRIERSSVHLAPIGQADLALDGRRLTDPAPWTSEHLRAGSRVFTIDRSTDVAYRRPVAGAEPDGTVQYSRSPQLDRDRWSELVVDAVRRAECADGSLWQQRPGPSRTIVVPFGLLDEQLVAQPMRQISITLEPARPAAVIGPESFREPLTRALLVEAAASYGPADLGIVIATRPDRLGRWDWAKWLPHLRHGDDIALLSADPELALWAERLGAVPPAGPNRTSGSDRTTLLVLDDADLWSRGDSPWRQLVTGPPADVVMLALADRVAGAPAATRTIVVHDSDQRCTMTAVGRAQPLPGILPALVETDLAASVARALAPLRDAELPPVTTSAAPTAPSTSLTEALTRLPPPMVAAVGPAPTTVTLGTSASGSVIDREFRAGTTCAIEGADGNDVAGTAMAVILSMVEKIGTAHPVVLVAPAGRSSLSEVLTRLDLFVGRCNADDPDQFARTQARIGHHLDHGGGVTIVVEDAQRHPDIAASASQLVLGRSDARVISTATIRPDAGNRSWAHAPEAALRITIDRRDGRPRGRVVVTIPGDAEIDEAFVPFEMRSWGPHDELVVRPFVYGRALTTLERQLERSGYGRESSPFGAQVLELVDRLAHAGRAGAGSRPATLVPPPLPAVVEMARLLATHEADAVPIGLADDPARGRHEVVWWQPGATGSMLFVGGPRSGMDAAIGSIPIGIAERYSPGDVHLHSIDSSSRRLGAVQQLAHTRAAVTPDRLDLASAIVDMLAAEVVARRDTGPVHAQNGGDRPDLLLLIGDLAQLGRRLTERSYTATLENLRLLAAAGDVGVNVVAAVSRASESCGLVDLVESIFVAVPDGPDAEVGPGRCDWSITGQRVQLAAGAPTGESYRSDRER